MNIHGLRRPAKGHQQRLFTYPFHSEPREGFCTVILRREIGWSHPKLLSPYLHPEFLEENLLNEFFNDHIEERFRLPLSVVFAFPLLFWCFSSLFPQSSTTGIYANMPNKDCSLSSIYCCPQDFRKTDEQSAFRIISIHLLNWVLLVLQNEPN